MKKSLLVAITLATLTLTTNAKPQRISEELKDGGGSEPPCPITICGNPK